MPEFYIFAPKICVLLPCPPPLPVPDTYVTSPQQINEVWVLKQVHVGKVDAPRCRRVCMSSAAVLIWIGLNANRLNTNQFPRKSGPRPADSGASRIDLHAH